MVYGDMYFMMNFGVVFVEFVLVFFVLGNYVWLVVIMCIWVISFFVFY